MSSNKLPLIIKEKVFEATQKAVTTFLSVDPDKRKELEEKGVNLATFVYEHVAPVIDNTRVKNLLIIMTEGIGNMVMLTPAIKLLKNMHPLIKITVLGKEPALQVIRGWDMVDNVITEFDNNYYDLCFVTIWGAQFFEENSDIIKDYCKQIITSSFSTYHESIQHAAIYGFLGGYEELCLPHCEIAKGNEKDDIDVRLKNIKNKFIIFGDTLLRNHGWDNKRWPHYVELAKMFNKRKPDYDILLIGDTSDLEEAKLKEWTSNVKFDFMGNINLQQLAYLISKSDFYIGNDTGPTHIAAAVGTKTYAIFGPTLTGKNKPLGENVTILNKRLPCSPCQYTEKFETCECMNYFTAQEVYDQIYNKEHNTFKPRVILVGDFSPGALRNEIYIKRCLEQDFKYKVIPFDYRVGIHKNGPTDTSYSILNLAVHHEPEFVLICGGQQLIPEVLIYFNYLLPNTKLINWYVDNRGKVEPWFKQLSSVCHSSYWSTGDPRLLSQVFSQAQKPCNFLPITPYSFVYHKLDIEKDIDVLFVGTPHSKERVELLEYLVDNKVKIRIYGNGEWPEKLKPFVNPGVFDKEFNTVLNRSKIVVNINILNNVPLYFSDRYFYPMAVRTVGLNFAIPKLEEMFEDGKHMVFFTSKEDCLEKIKELLNNDEKREYISEEGYKLYLDKYTLTMILKSIIEDNNGYNK